MLIWYLNFSNFIEKSFSTKFSSIKDTFLSATAVSSLNETTLQAKDGILKLLSNNESQET